MVGASPVEVPVTRFHPPATAPRHALSLDFESLLKCALEPLHFGSGADRCEVVPLQECSKISLAVVVQTWVVLTTLEPQLMHFSGNLLLPVHRRVPGAI